MHLVADAMTMIVGAMLLIAGVAKVVAGVGRFEQAVASFDLFPERLRRATAIGTPAVEIALGSALVADLAGPLAPVVAAVVLVALALAVALTVHRGRAATCGCFGLWTETVRMRLAYRDLALALALTPKQLLEHAPSAVAIAALSAGGLAIAAVAAGWIHEGQKKTAEEVR